MATLKENIKDLNLFIQTLFEQGVRHTLEECRKSHFLAVPYSTPIPDTYYGIGDYETVNQRISSNISHSKVQVAFDLAYPIRENIEFYDLICCALCFTMDKEKKKFFIHEILKYTKSESLRDYYAEQLYKLNQEIKKEKEDSEFKIFNEVIPSIEGYEKLKIKDTVYDFSHCIYSVSKIIKSKSAEKYNIELISRNNPIFSGYPVIETKFIAYNIQYIKFIPGEESYKLRIRKAEIGKDSNATGIVLEAKAEKIFQIYDPLYIHCDRIEIISCQIVEEDPYEGKTGFCIRIDNNTSSELSVEFKKKNAIFNGDHFLKIKTPKDTLKIRPNDFITIELGEFPKGEEDIFGSDLYSIDHPKNLIKKISDNGEELDKDIFLNDKNWGCWEFSACSPYPEYDISLTHVLTIN